MTGSGKLHSNPKQDLGLGCVHNLTHVTPQGYVENENIVLCEFGSQVKESASEQGPPPPAKAVSLTLGTGHRV